MPARPALCAFAAVLVLAGCGGTAPTPSFSIADLPKIAVVQPSGSTDVSYQEESEDSGFVSLADLRKHEENTSDEAVIQAIQDAGFRRGYLKSWYGDAATPVSAGASLLVFRDAQGATSALDTLRRSIREEYAGSTSKVDEIPTGALGEEAWAEHVVDADNGENFEYLWRTGNLLVYTNIGCYEDRCKPEYRIGQAARAYANAIDVRAKEAATQHPAGP